MSIDVVFDPPSRSDAPDVFVEKADALLAQLNDWSSQANALAAALNLNSTTDTSLSSVAIGLGAKTFTVSSGKSFQPGMYLVVADAAAPTTNAMLVQVTSYSGTSLVTNSIQITGSGTKASWVISQSAYIGPGDGDKGDISVSGGVWSIDNNVIAAKHLAASVIPHMALLNGYIAWSISGNALTVSIKTQSGTDPSAANPVYAVFRNETLATEGYYVRTITAATSVTASSGSTLGTVSAVPSRIRAVLIDDAGTVVLGLYNSYDATNNFLLGLEESDLYTTTAEGGAGAADSAHVIYTTAAKTSKAIREAGYVESTQTTAGTWAQTLTKKVTANGSGYRRTGDIVRRRQVTKTDTDSIASTTLTDITGLSITTALQSDCNLVELYGHLSINSGNGLNNAPIALLRDATPIVQADSAGSRVRSAISSSTATASQLNTASFNHLYKPGASASAAYKLQWAASSSTMYLNRSSTDTDSNAFCRSTSVLGLREIFA
jgi:hypothetical protein